jgi:FKBP-type peptidyl-prolyl cis-trans isomerase FkpA
MKTNRPFFLLATITILAIAFSSFAKDKKKKQKFAGYTPMANGSYFIQHKRGLGKDSSDVGGAVFVKVKFKTEKDSIFLDINQATRNASFPMRITAPLFKGDYADIMGRLHVGDSVSFFIRLDSLKKYYPQEFKFEPQFDTMKYLGFTMQVDSLYSKAKIADLQAKAAAEQAEMQMKMQKARAVMQPIQDSARVKEPKLRENDFAMLSDYIKNTWKGPRNPDGEGVFYMETVHGAGPPVTPGMTVSVKYTGKYLDGTIFDSNTLFEGQDLLTFRYGVDQMIEGFTMCIGKMNVGTKSVFILPARLGYKDGLTRIFEVELVYAK